MVGNKLFYGDAHFSCILEEAEGLDILVCRVNPRANEGDFLVAEVEVGVHGAFACIYEEAHFAISAAATNVLISISSCLRNAGALEYEICAEAVGEFLNLGNSLFDGLKLTEVDNRGSAHFLCKSKTGVNAVNSDDVYNACRLKYCNLHKTDRSAALYENGGAEVDEVGGSCAVPRMNANASGLDEHSFINGHTVNNENRGVLTNENMFSKPTVVVMLCVVFDKTVNTEAFAEVGKLGETTAVITLAAEKNGGNNLISNLDGVALGIGGNAFADCYNLTCSFVTENDFLISEGIVTIFVNVGSADAAAFNLNEDFAGAWGGDFDVAKLYDCLSFNTVNDFRLYEISYF